MLICQFCNCIFAQLFCLQVLFIFIPPVLKHVSINCKYNKQNTQIIPDQKLRQSSPQCMRQTQNVATHVCDRQKTQPPMFVTDTERTVCTPVKRRFSSILPPFTKMSFCMKYKRIKVIVALLPTRLTTRLTTRLAARLITDQLPG